MFSGDMGQESVIGEGELILSTMEDSDNFVTAATPTVPHELGDLADQQPPNNGHSKVTKSSEEVAQESVIGEGEQAPHNSEEVEDCAPSVVTPFVLLGSDVPTDQNQDVEAQVRSLLANPEIKTDDPQPRKIPFTDEMKDELRPLLEEGARIATEFNKESLKANLRRGKFLIKIRETLNKMKLRAFRAVCATLGWSKTSAYDWIKLYKSFGEHLTDYDGVPERNLIILASHPKGMDLLDRHYDEIRDLAASDLRKWLKEEEPRHVDEQSAKHVTKIDVKPFLVTRRRDTTIKGLNDGDFEALIGFLKARAKQRNLKEDGTSDASDTSAEIRNFAEKTIEEVCSDSGVENAVAASVFPKPPDFRMRLLDDPPLENDSNRSIAVEEKFYEPALLCGLFPNWIQKNQEIGPNGTDLDFHLFIYRKSNGGGYWIHDSRLYWMEDAWSNHATLCDQNDLWKNRKDLSWVGVHTCWNSAGDPACSVTAWDSFAQFIEAIPDNGRGEPDGGLMVHSPEEGAIPADSPASGVSIAMDTPAQIRDFAEKTIEEVCSDTGVEDAVGQSETNSENNEHIDLEEEEEEDSPPTSQDASPNETGDSSTSKPSRVRLIRTFANGREQTDILMGDDIPEKEDWEEYADNLWEQAVAEKKQFERIRMEDADGRIYLHEMVYGG